jgi:hypothetical protein
MAERGRTPGFVMGPEHRTKIANSQILNRLIACGEGGLELTAVQKDVCLGLLKKVLPDLNSNTHSGDPENNTPIGVRWMNSPDEKL